MSHVPSRGRRDVARYTAVILVAAAVLALVVLSTRFTSGTPEPRVRGQLTNVEARDIGHAASIRLRAQDGRELQFQVDPAFNMTPGHLREHMTFGEPVTVYYRREGTALIALRAAD